VAPKLTNFTKQGWLQTNGSFKASFLSPYLLDNSQYMQGYTHDSVLTTVMYKHMLTIGLYKQILTCGQSKMPTDEAKGEKESYSLFCLILL